MKSSLGFSKLILISAIVTGCGKVGDLVTVTLQTGLENNRPIPNMMESFSSLSNNLYGPSPTCKQTEIRVGYGPHTNGGNKSFNTYLVSMTTATALPSASDPLIAWLTNATMSPIQVQIPKNEPYDFGMIGALILSTDADSNGNCLKFASPGVPNSTYSMLGHASATFTSDAIVPIKLWTLPVSTAPVTPLVGTSCNNIDHHDEGVTQDCPNLNFNKVICHGNDCNIGYANYIQYSYFPGSNGTPPITQLIVAVNSPNDIVSYLPDVDGLNVTSYNSSNAVIISTAYSNSNSYNTSYSPRADFPDGSGSYINVISGGGVTPLGLFDIQSVNYTPTGFTVQLNTSVYRANSYINLSDKSATPGIVNPIGTATTTSYSIPSHFSDFNLLHGSSSFIFSLQTQASNNVYVSPPSNSSTYYYSYIAAPTSDTSTNDNAITVTFTQPSNYLSAPFNGNLSYKVRYGTMGATYPSGFTNVLSASTPSVTISGLTNHSYYDFVVETYFNGNLIGVSPVLTAQP